MEIQSAVNWKDGASPVAWQAGRIYFIRRRVANGVFDGWSSLPDGTDEKCHTDIPAYPSNTHAGISDVTSDGKFAVLTVERSGTWPFKAVVDGDASASPGRGFCNDVWIQNLQTNTAWKVKSVTAQGVIWPRFSKDGTRLVWSELTKPQLFLPGLLGLGEWTLYTATINWTSSGFPVLYGIKSKVTTGFIEPYGFSDDNSKVLFAGDRIVGKYFDSTCICEMNSDLTGTAKILSPNFPTTYWNNYNEFAYRVPNTSILIFGRTTGSQANGVGYYNSVEYWTMNNDGSAAAQLTDFGKNQGSTSIGGSLAFNPDNPKQFVAAFASDGASDIYKSKMITLK